MNGLRAFLIYYSPRGLVLEYPLFGILRIGFEYGDLCNTDPVLLPGADANGNAVLHINDGIGRDPLLHVQPKSMSSYSLSVGFRGPHGVRLKN